MAASRGGVGGSRACRAGDGGAVGRVVDRLPFLLLVGEDRRRSPPAGFTQRRQRLKLGAVPVDLSSAHGGKLVARGPTTLPISLPRGLHCSKVEKPGSNGRPFGFAWSSRFMAEELVRLRRL